MLTEPGGRWGGHMRVDVALLWVVRMRILIPRSLFPGKVKAGEFLRMGAS